MKGSSRERASHVNTGTGMERADAACAPTRGPVFRHPKLTATTERSDATAFGGLALAARLVATLGVDRAIDRNLSLLRSHRPYRESDHVLTHAYNLFVGGTAIEDIADLQVSEPVRRILGAQQIPDPTTAGDFLRRFDQQSIANLDRAIDEVQRRAWKKQRARKKGSIGLVDLDSHVHHVYGDQKQGADFTYKGGFGYHPLVVSLAETQECLRIINRPGNVASAEGAADCVRELAPLLRSRYERVIVRGDSAFANQSIFDACEDEGMHFAMVSPRQANFDRLADEVPESRWKTFRAHERDGIDPRKRRRRQRNVRRQHARRRGKRDLKLERQWIAEIPYQPARSERTYRLIIRRQRIEESLQGELFELWRYRFVLTNLPRSTSAEKAVRLTYQRCDQENVIEQLQNGVAAMRMPTGTLLANHAFLICARIAHNMKAWLAALALPRETMRWEWKRFRRAFVYLSARVTKTSRQTLIRFADSHRFAATTARGITRLQT